MKILIKKYKTSQQLVNDLTDGALIRDSTDPLSYYKMHNGTVTKFTNYVETNSGIDVNNIHNYFSRRGFIEQTKDKSQGCGV